MATRVCVFDAYGTLFDVTAAARKAAARPDGAALADIWPAVAEDWRRKQLEYSWLRAAAGRHADFWQVTQDGLDWALDRAGLSGDASLRETLLGLYWQLDAYPEAPAVLVALGNAGLPCAILSNGSPAMLDAAVQAAGLAPLLDAVLSVEAAGVFKPAPAVYDLVGARYGTEPGEVLFVSANGWDAGFASAYGFRTAWVNRRAEPVDRLPATPAHILIDLSPLTELI